MIQLLVPSFWVMTKEDERPQRIPGFVEPDEVLSDDDDDPFQFLLAKNAADLVPLETLVAKHAASSLSPAELAALSSSSSSSQTALLYNSALAGSPHSSSSSSTYSSSSSSSLLALSSSSAYSSSSSVSTAANALADKLPVLKVEINRNLLATYHDIFPVMNTIKFIFNQPDDPVDEIFASLQDPFSDRNGTSIVWTMVRTVKHFSSITNLRKSVCSGYPWSILSVGDEVVRDDVHNVSHVVVKKNYIYDGDGRVRAEVDFGDSKNPDLHVHQLIPSELDHMAPGAEHHCLPWRECPWIFSAQPDMVHHSGQVAVMAKVGDGKEGRISWVRVKLRCDFDLFADSWDS